LTVDKNQSRPVRPIFKSDGSTQTFGDITHNCQTQAASAIMAPGHTVMFVFAWPHNIWLQITSL